MANTLTLEETLRQVERLRGDLSATIKETERGHTETEYNDGGGWDSMSRYIYGETIDRWVVDKPAEPDIKKQEAARQELQQTYDSSECYSARYAAKRDLGAKPYELEEQIHEWLGELEEDLKAVDIMGGWDSKDRFLMRSRRLFGGKIVKRLNNGKESFCLEFADSLKRINAVNELGELFRLSNSPVIKKSLKKAYQNDCYLAKELAGEYLGYSKFRNWINEIPVAVAATAAASGLGYALYQYMVR